MKTLIKTIETIACALGLHAWTGWAFHWQQHVVHIKTRTCKVCGTSQVRSV